MAPKATGQRAPQLRQFLAQPPARQVREQVGSVVPCTAPSHRSALTPITSVRTLVVSPAVFRPAAALVVNPVTFVSSDALDSDQPTE